MDFHFKNGNDENLIFDANDAEKHVVPCALGYIPLLFFIPLIVDNASNYCRFHANQGLNLTLLSLCFGLVNGFLKLFGHIPLLGYLFDFIGWIFSAITGAIVIVYIIIGVVNAVNMTVKRLPMIGVFNFI